MKKQSITFLTDAVQINAVVPTGRSGDILKAVYAAGVVGSIVHGARGTGAREHLGLLGIAVEADKEVISLIAPADYQDFLAEVIYNSGELGVPGNGYLYVVQLERLATYIPEQALDRLEGEPS